MIAHVVAISSNNCIGKNGTLPWKIPADMKHFKEVTMGHAVIMGRKTWESIPEKFRPLPGRENIVLTRQKDYDAPGAKIVSSLNEALHTEKAKDIMIIGGGEIYSMTMNMADTLFVTHIHKDIDGDTFYPEISPDTWDIVQIDKHDGFSFVTYKQK